MKVDYGEIIFQSTEGITEDKGMVQFCGLDLLRVIQFGRFQTFSKKISKVRISKNWSETPKCDLTCSKHPSQTWIEPSIIEHFTGRRFTHSIRMIRNHIEPK